MSASTPVLTAIITALEADAPFMALVNSQLWDGAPPDDVVPVMPYSIMGDETETEEATHDARGYSHTVTFHEWSSYAGRSELLAIREARNTVLEDQVLTVVGWAASKISYEFGDVLTEWDPELGRHIRHQVTRYRVSTTETP